MKLISSSILLLSAAVAVASALQDPSEPAPVFPDANAPGLHHEHLQRMIGEWDFAVSVRSEPDAAPVEFAGVVTRVWVLDDRFVHEQVRAESPTGSFRGVGYIGYNTMDGHYQMVWMSNMSTAIGFETGTFDETTKVMTFRSANRDPVTGRLVHARGEFDLSRGDRQTFSAYAVGPDGGEFESFRGTFTRRQ